MNRIVRDRSFRLSILLTLIFLGTGMIFLLAGLSDFSLVLFLLLPVVLGISIGALPGRRTAIAGAVLAIIVFLVCLLALGLSGFICVLMSLPLIIVFMFIGSVLAHLVNRYHQIRSDRLPVLLLPLLLFVIAAPVEKAINGGRQLAVSVQTQQVFPYTPEQVFDAIKSVDTLDAEKPFLMRFDLPIPTKCILGREEVGGTRTCYFKGGNMSQADFGGGTIVERITELQRGKTLKMDVVSYNLIGRKWLGFREAIYYFDKVGDSSCRLTRITTYTSVLKPRLYWEPMEKLGIRQEHDYVFANLAKDLRNRYGR